MIGTRIQLNEVECRLCKHIAKQRYSINRENNVMNAKIGEQSNEMTDLEGFAGELAFCKMFNIYPDLTVKVNRSAEDKGDCILYGKTVDVKTTKYKTGKLLAAIWKVHYIDLYALMIGEFPVYIFKGFMKAEELLKIERLQNLGHGEGYVAHQLELIEL